MAIYNIGSDQTYKTIADVNNLNLQPGDQVLFKRGETFDDTPLVITDSGTDGSEIVFTSYGTGNKPVIGNYEKTYYAAIRISEYSRGGGIAGDDVDYVIIDNLKVIASKETDGCEGISIKGNNNIVQNCEIYGGTTGYIGSEKIGIRIHKSDANLDILDNEISYFRHGLHIYQPGEVLIEGNYIHHIYYSDGTANVGGNNIRFTADGDYPWDCEYDVLVKGNTLTHFDHSALWTGLVSNLIIEYNLIEESLDETIYRGGVKHGNIGKMFDDTNKLEGNSGIIFRYNVVRDLHKYGQPGYTYDTDGTVLSTNNGYPRPVYKEAWIDGSDFGIEPDHVPDAIIGGGGHCGMWIHNNVFYNIDKKVFARGYSRADASGYGCSSGRDCGDPIPYSATEIAHFYNNTVYDCGERKYITAHGGLVNTEFDSQSPTYVKNNIFHHANTDENASNIEFQEEGDAVSNNIHMNKSGMGDYQDWGAVNTDNHAISVFFRTIDDSEELYSTDPLFNNSSSEVLYLSNIGYNGVTIPDFRVSEESPALGGGATIGNDPSGRSVDDYDIMGNSRSSSSIGAIGAIDSTLTTTLTVTLTVIQLGTTPPEPGTGRVTRGLQVLYDFNEGTGDIINDKSGVGTPLNLKIKSSIKP